MLTVTRLLFASAISLGLASSATASPITFEDIYSEARESIESFLDTKQAKLNQAGASISTSNLPFSAQFIDLSANQPKQKPPKVSKVAEPSSLILLGLGLLGLGFLRRRKH